MKLQNLREIIPLIEQGLTCKQIGDKYDKAESTVWTWYRKLRKAGYNLPTKKGRSVLKL